jgi:hypothetical protein
MSQNRDRMNISVIYGDYALCCSWYYRFVLRNIRMCATPPDDVERVVELVWTSLGLVGNSGFRCYFESDVNNDPGCVSTMAAYKEIGAARSHLAFVYAAECFPSGKIPDDVAQRLRVVSSIPSGRFTYADSLYQESINEVVTCLAGYIRAYQYVAENPSGSKKAARCVRSPEYVSM